MADDIFEAMRQEHVAAHAETRRHFDVALERMETRFDTLAEGVARLDVKVDRRAADLEELIELGFADSQTMIKFSHAKL